MCILTDKSCLVQIIAANGGVLCRNGTWSVTLGAECVLGVFESEVLGEVLGAKREEVRGGWKNSIARSFMICAFGQSFGTCVCGR